MTGLKRALPFGVRLADCAVFIDFDGTLTTADTGVHLLDRLAPAAWRAVEAEYKAGVVGSRSCMERQWSLLPRDRAAIEAAVREVPLDPAAAELIALCRSCGAEVVIVSDGYGFRAEEVGAELDVPVLTNRIDWQRHAVVFSPPEPSCPCGECGTCKRAPIEDARRRGRITVLVGDGVSDLHGAKVADVVFAKGELARRCEEAGLRHTTWESLSDVVASLRAWDAAGVSSS